MADAGAVKRRYEGSGKSLYSGILIYYNYLNKKMLLTHSPCNFILSDSSELPAGYPSCQSRYGIIEAMMRVTGILAGD